MDLRGALTAPQVNHRPAIVDPAGIGALLRAIDGFDGQPTTRAALRLAAYVFVRPGELRHAEWKEFDLDTAVWSIPAAEDEDAPPAPCPVGAPITGYSPRIAGDHGRGALAIPVSPIDRPAHSENFERSPASPRLWIGRNVYSRISGAAATRLNEMGRWNADAIERQFAHQEANAVRRAYTHSAEYWPERVLMMQAWADYLDGLREGGKVVPLIKARAG